MGKVGVVFAFASLALNLALSGAALALDVGHATKACAPWDGAALQMTVPLGSVGPIGALGRSGDGRVFYGSLWGKGLESIRSGVEVSVPNKVSGNSVGNGRFSVCKGGSSPGAVSDCSAPVSAVIRFDRVSFAYDGRRIRGVARFVLDGVETRAPFDTEITGGSIGCG